MVPDVRGLWKPILRSLCSFSLLIKFPLENDHFHVRKPWPFLEVWGWGGGGGVCLNYQE